MPSEKHLKRARNAIGHRSRCDCGDCVSVAAALEAVERETAERCAEIVMDAEVEHVGTGYMRAEDSRGTLANAATDIRAEFGIAEKEQRA